MSYKKFDNNDIFYNVIKAKPKFEFKIYRGNAYLNNGFRSVLLNDIATDIVACVISLDFSCADNSQYIGVI